MMLEEYKHRAWQLAAQKTVARLLVYKAVASGDLVRPSICSRCTNTTGISGHHEDYSKPLEVVWLCPKCHRARHREIEGTPLSLEEETRAHQEDMAAIEEYRRKW